MPESNSGEQDAARTDLAEEESITRRYGYTREEFLARLEPSQAAAYRTKKFLEQHGVQVEVPRLQVRSRLGEIKEFTKSEADLLLRGTPFAIEVKWRRKLRFTEPSEFGYSDISVDTVSGYQGKRRKPLAYVMVSGDHRGAIVLPTFTHAQWTQRRKKDVERGLWDDFYFAPKWLFHGRRKWLVGLCLELQRADPPAYEEILCRHGWAGPHETASLCH